MAKKGKPSYEDLQDKVKQLESKVKLLEGAMDSARRYVVQWSFERWVACPLTTEQQDALIRAINPDQSPDFTKMSEKVIKEVEGIQTLETIWLAPNFLPGYSRYVTRHDVYRGNRSNFWAWVLLPC